MGSIQLTKDELKEIDRKQKIVLSLNSSGAFNVRGGSVILHFDGDGNLRKVERQDVLLRE